MVARATWCARAVLALAIVLCSSVAAAADLVDGTRGAVIEREHTITLALDRGHARLRVERTLFNPGSEFDEGVIDLELPPGAAAVGLRTLAEQDGRARWYDADLLDADTAATRYEQLVGVGVREPKDPALLHWLTPASLRLRVFPIAPASRKAVAYDLVVPTHYVEGEHVLELPRLGSESIAARVELVAAQAGDTLALDGEIVASGTALVLERPHRLALRPRTRRCSPRGWVAWRWGPTRWSGSSSRPRPRSRASPTTPTWWCCSTSRVRTRPRSRRRRRPHAALRHFAGHGTPAFAVMSFARTVREHTRGFVDLDAATAELAGDLPTANGSRIDDALRAAAARLREAPAGAPRRVLLFTDALARGALAPASLRASLAEVGALVHVIEIDSGAPTLERIDHGAWSRLAAATGGLRWRGRALLEDDGGAVFESLVRPTQLDHVQVLARGGDPLLDDVTLREGTGARVLELRGPAAGAITLRAQLWSKPIHEVLRADASYSRLVAALAVATDIAEQLSQRELAVLRAAAVRSRRSRATSRSNPASDRCASACATTSRCRSSARRGPTSWVGRCWARWRSNSTASASSRPPCARPPAAATVPAAASRRCSSSPAPRSSR
ncbi:MAG: hypothetical protein U0168_11925 [Nannocystaceae bacterium]